MHRSESSDHYTPSLCSCLHGAFKNDYIFQVHKSGDELVSFPVCITVVTEGKWMIIRCLAEKKEKNLKPSKQKNQNRWCYFWRNSQKFRKEHMRIKLRKAQQFTETEKLIDRQKASYILRNKGFFKVSLDGS